MAKTRMTFQRVSPVTGEKNTMTMEVDQDDLNRWMQGELIQNAMPYLTPDEREFLMTGILPEEWEQMFGRHSGQEQVQQTHEEVVVKVASDLVAVLKDYAPTIVSLGDLQAQGALTWENIEPYSDKVEELISLLVDLFGHGE